jgi:Ca2+-binding RTX toxin-like protein
VGSIDQDYPGGIVTNYVHRIGDETTAHANNAGVQTAPATAALSSGGYVVVWSDANGDGSGRSIHAQRFDASGAKAGAELLVNTTIAGDQGSPVVIGLSSGGFAVAWAHEGGSIRGRVFGADGTALGADFQVHTSFEGNQTAPSLLALADGGFVASWTGVSTGDIAAQRFSAAGDKLGAEFRANTTVAGTQELSSGSALAGGGYVLVWAQSAGAVGDGDDVRGQRFDSDGHAVGAEFLLSTDDLGGGTSGRQYAPDVAGLPGGGFVAVWQSFNGALGRFEARAQIFGADGGKVGSEFTPSNPANDVSNVSVAALSWGGFIVAWDNAAMTSPSERAQLFDSDGSRLGDQFGLDLGGLGLIPGLDIATTTAGDRLVAAWQNAAQDVKVQLFTTGLYGTAGPDDLAGTADDDLIFGYGADDLLKGGGGADIIRGGDGRDEIFGGTGADTLIGGNGDDTYYVYAVDSATFEDSIVELAGGGFDQIRTTLPSFSLAGLPEVESLFGIIDIAFTLTGNDGDNYIIGNNSADTLEGGPGNDKLEGMGGADTMRGGAGDDEYIVLDAGDVVEENADEGTDLVWAAPATYSLLGTNVENLFAIGNIGHNLRGNASANLIVGQNSDDLLQLQDGGDDEVQGIGGNDVIYFGPAFTGADSVDGGSGRDVVVLQGNYALTLSATNLVGVESISLQSGSRTTWGDVANNFYDYSLTTNNANVAAGQQLIVNGQTLRAGEDFSFDGSAETDGYFLVYGGHGVDTLKGGAGNDAFFFEGVRWGAGDTVDGGAGRDALIISSGSGVNHFDFGANALTGIESISLNNRYTTDPSQKPSYELVLSNGNVAPGATLIVNGSSLADRSQTVGVDGSAVHDGNLILFGGFGNDTLTGGDGADLFQGGEGIDMLTGGAGTDVFHYAGPYDATAQLPDRILDFASGVDKIDLTRIDADQFAAGDQAFHWIGSAAFGAAGAASAGELRAYAFNGSWYVEGDMDGNGSADLVIQLTIPAAPPVQGDFLL